MKLTVDANGNDANSPDFDPDNIVQFGYHTVWSDGMRRTLISIVLPQSIPAVIAVGLGHFIWAWNDYFEPLVYLSAARDLQPIALGIQSYNSLFSTEPHLIQASSLLGLLLPVLLFFIFQCFFMRGIAFTGVEK
jgi:multiple sugar transport system permease protein